MRSDFDALRRAPLPASFDATAAFVRRPRPPRRRPGRSLAVVAVLALAAGACAWPVSAPLRLGSVIETTAADPYAVVRALDALVPAASRLGTEVEPVGGGRSVVRYAVLGADAPREAAAALGGPVRVTPLAADVRTPLGVVAARQVGVSLSPRLSEAETQAALDRAFAGSRLAPRVGRDPAGRRVVEVAPGVRLLLRPGARLVPLTHLPGAAGGPAGRHTVRGAAAVVFDAPVPPGQRRAALDSLLGPDVPTVRRRIVVSRADAARLLDSLGIDASVLSRGDSTPPPR